LALAEVETRGVVKGEIFHEETKVAREGGLANTVGEDFRTGEKFAHSGDSSRDESLKVRLRLIVSARVGLRGAG